jgi:glucose-6-phosphate 1-dehydrogenase
VFDHVETTRVIGAEQRPSSDALVFFGATGDLAYKKIFPALQAVARTRQAQFSRDRRCQVRVDARATHRAGARKRETYGGGEDPAAFDALAQRLRYVDGDSHEAATFTAIKAELRERVRPAYYLAIPPSMFPVVLRKLSETGAIAGARVIIERPFGRDLDSAVALNRLLHQVLAEDSIFRIDHYLGKEAVQNILYFRFANALFFGAHLESALRGECADHDGRRVWRERSREVLRGARRLRDVIQNHLLQVVSYLATEAPSSTYPEAIRDEQAKVLRNVRPMSIDSLIRGQFRGYRHERGVARDSAVPTFGAFRLFVNSWRWSGVLFFVRAGKCLKSTVTEVFVEPRVRHKWFSRRRRHPLATTSASGSVRASRFAIGARAKRPGHGRPACRIVCDRGAASSQNQSPRIACVATFVACHVASLRCLRTLLTLQAIVVQSESALPSARYA